MTRSPRLPRRSPHGALFSLSQWFPYASEKVNYVPTPFKADSTFELSLAETFTATPAEFHILEERYLGKSSAHIGKILHIM